MAERVEFRLSMPSHREWNSAGRTYVRSRRITDEQVRALFGTASRATWHHRWDDGWVAMVSGRLMERGERTPKSDGFAGYDWMIDNIIAYGSPYVTGTAENATPADAVPHA